VTLTLTLSAEQLAEVAQAVAEVLGVKASKRPVAKATLTVTETARMLGVAPCSIRRRIKAGLIPVVPGFHSVRIPRSHIDTLLGRTPGNPE